MKPFLRSGTPAKVLRPPTIRTRSAAFIAHLGPCVRFIGQWAYGCYAWTLFGVVILATGMLIAVLGSPALTRPLAGAAARLLFRLARMPVSAAGLEHLPPGPHILLVNHTSFLDGIVLSALLPARPGYAFVVKQQYRRQAVLWPFLKGLGTVLLSTTAPGHRSANVEKLAVALRDGQRLVIFPEGAIDPAPGVKKFHSGTFIAAARAGVPLVVAGLSGARNALRLGTWLPRRAAIHLEVGPTFMPLGRDPLSILRVTRATHEAIVPLSGETDRCQLD